MTRFYAFSASQRPVSLLTSSSSRGFAQISDQSPEVYSCKAMMGLMKTILRPLLRSGPKLWPFELPFDSKIRALNGFEVLEASVSERVSGGSLTIGSSKSRQGSQQRPSKARGRKPLRSSLGAPGCIASKD